jgi:DNA-binding NarL/FixJ family response regulator
VTPIRVCTCEDDRRYRETLALVIGLHPDLVLVDSFADPAALLQAARAGARWDLVLMDLDLPGMDGVAATRALRAALPDQPVVMLTAFDDPTRIHGAIRAGASGYLLKSAGEDELVASIRRAAEGHVALSPDVARAVLDLIRGDIASAPRTGEPAPELSKRERDLLRALVDGRSYKQAADDLGVSIDTIRTYVRSLYKKLGVHSATEAVSKALREGWIG